VLPPEVKAAVRGHLAASGQEAELVEDLCGMAARKDPRLAELAQAPALKIAACHPRAVRWLFNAAGTPLAVGRTEFLNLRTQEADAVNARLDSADLQPGLPEGSSSIPSKPIPVPTPSTPRTGVAAEWKPWFPVIDYERCTDCMQCLSFCLFGVYGVDPGNHIQVQSPENCKTNCPACSRVCPEAAIIFPKYKSSPINGDRVKESDVQREAMKVDISALLGGDIYALLRERSTDAKKRFSKERSPDQALVERRQCLAKLAQLGDIPPEVLMSLPRPEEIQRRAEEARLKAQTAIAAQQSATSESPAP
jgi:NAD-dependent dihydropyrimidine dehydrogenase PreA subunit